MTRRVAIRAAEGADGASAKKPKAYHESFARFFEIPSRDALRDLLKGNPGELRWCDFKAEWPEASALSKHVLGLANSGGGCLVIGVEERADGTLVSVGMETLKDKADATNALKNYVAASLMRHIDVVDFSYEASEYPSLVGKKFQVVFVDDDPTRLPFVALRAGKNCRHNAIYVRREGVTDEATHEELQEVLNRRVVTGHSTQPEIDLAGHLDQLKVLYERLQPFRIKWVYAEQMATLMSDMVAKSGMTGSVPNPRYPKEDFEAFVLRMVEEKKKRIERELDLRRP